MDPRIRIQSMIFHSPNWLVNVFLRLMSPIGRFAGQSMFDQDAPMNMETEKGKSLIASVSMVWCLIGSSQRTLVLMTCVNIHTFT